MSRRPGTCPGALTKTQQLRQAKSAALVRDQEQRQEAAMRQQADPFKVRKRVVRPEPKKVDFTKPGMTKAMLAKMKHSEKFKQEFERKQEALTTGRVPKRTAAPIGGDARMGRERVPGRERRTPHVTPTTTPRTSPVRREYEAGPSRLPSIRRPVTLKTPRTAEKSLTRKTTELAKMMNADVVVAEPVSDGPISNIVIPPGIVNENRTTIVNISQPAGDMESRVTTSQVANRSIQVISETLDEQDAAEAAVVQSRLTELQQARRDFVIAVANVGGNAVNLEDETPPDIFLESPMSPLQYQPSPPRRLIQVPEVDDEMLQLEYGRDHPDIVAAREFMMKARAEREAREAARRMDEEFAEIAGHIRDPLEDDYLWQEEEEDPVYQYEPFDPDELERFFDTRAYPPCPRCHGPPSGKEQLHPDLWELEDPWYREAPPPDVPDLIQFD